MNLSTTLEIDASAAFVFAEMTVFSRYEAQISARDGQVIQRAGTGPTGIGWDIAIPLWGQRFNLTADVTRLDAPLHLCVTGTSPGMSGALTVDLMAMSPERTRMRIAVNVKALSIVAKVKLRTLRFGGSSVNAAFARRVGDYAQEIEQRYGGTASQSR